jgi:hypothetical protein
MTEVVAYIRRIIANGGIADMVMICVPEYSPEFSLSSCGTPTMSLVWEMQELNDHLSCNPRR